MLLGPFLELLASHKRAITKLRPLWNNAPNAITVVKHVTLLPLNAIPVMPTSIGHGSRIYALAKQAISRIKMCSVSFATTLAKPAVRLTLA